MYELATDHKIGRTDYEVKVPSIQLYHLRLTSGDSELPAAALDLTLHFQVMVEYLEQHSPINQVSTFHLHLVQTFCLLQ